MSDWQTILDAMGCQWHLVGSRFTSSIVRPDSDWDYLVYLPEHEMTHCLTGALCTIGFEREGGLHYPVLTPEAWQSLRRADVNLIVTGSEWLVAKHKMATDLCRFLDVTDKMMRKELFREVFGEPTLDAKWQQDFIEGYTPCAFSLVHLAASGEANDLPF